MTSEKVRERKRKYYHEHKEHVRERQRQWRLKNLERYRLNQRRYTKKWQEKNREKYLESARRRSKISNKRKQELSNNIKKLTPDELLELVGYKLKNTNIYILVIHYIYCEDELLGEQEQNENDNNVKI